MIPRAYIIMCVYYHVYYNCRWNSTTSYSSFIIFFLQPKGWTQDVPMLSEVLSYVVCLCVLVLAVNNTVVLTIASLKYTVPYIVKYTYSTVLACMLV